MKNNNSEEEELSEGAEYIIKYEYVRLMTQLSYPILIRHFNEILDQINAEENGWA